MMDSCLDRLTCFAIVYIRCRSYFASSPRIIISTEPEKRRLINDYSLLFVVTRCVQKPRVLELFRLVINNYCILYYLYSNTRVIKTLDESSRRKSYSEL